MIPPIIPCITPMISIPLTMPCTAWLRSAKSFCCWCSGRGVTVCILSRSAGASVKR